MVRRLFAVVFPFLPALTLANAVDPWLSTGRSSDPTTKTLSEIRAAEKRRIPIEVALKAEDRYVLTDPVEVTVIVTNLFAAPLLLNRRMLVNHPRLQGEVAFIIEGPDGARREIQKLITPMAVREDDFVVLPRGQSIQRTVDLADLYDLKQKGTYKVRAFYHNDLDQPVGTLRVWKGMAGSEVSEISLE